MSADSKGRFNRHVEEEEEERMPIVFPDDDIEDDFDNFDDFDNIEPQQPAAAAPMTESAEEPAVQNPPRRRFAKKEKPEVERTDNTESKPKKPFAGLSMFHFDSAEKEEKPKEKKADEGFVPSMETPETRRRSRYKRRNKKPMPFWAKATLTGISLFLAFVVVYGGAFVLIMLGRIGSDEDFQKANLSAAEAAQIESEKLSGDEVYEEDFVVEDTPVVSHKDIDIILVAGTDARPSSGKISRADTIMIVAIDKKHSKIKMVSIQRDLYAIIPGYKRSKINTAYYYDSANGNADLKILKGTLEKNLSITFDDYVIVDFTAFATIVDMIGGVEVQVSADEAKYMCSDKKYGLFPRYASGAGTYVMSGKEALNYVRMRKLAGQDDFNRTRRQRDMLGLMMNEVKDQSYVDMAQLMYAIFPYISTSMSKSEMLGYVSEAASIIGYDMVQLSIPISGSWDYGQAEIGGVMSDVIVCNYTFNAQQLQKFIYDDDMSYTNGEKAEGVRIPSINNIQNNAKVTTSAQTTTTTTASN
ncbi:MAG: LCP family protein [Clostridia bacterium]|nr:LCP family protein [Clostridia bacterium]